MEGVARIGNDNALASRAIIFHRDGISTPDFESISQRRRLGFEPLPLQDRAQPFIDGALQTRRQHAGMLSQKAAVEGQKLEDIHCRVSRESRRARRQQDIPWSVSEVDVAGDRSYDWVVEYGVSWRFR